MTSGAEARFLFRKDRHDLKSCPSRFASCGGEAPLFDGCRRVVEVRAAKSKADSSLLPSVACRNDKFEMAIEAKGGFGWGGRPLLRSFRRNPHVSQKMRDMGHPRHG